MPSAFPNIERLIEEGYHLDAIKSSRGFTAFIFMLDGMNTFNQIEGHGDTVFAAMCNLETIIIERSKK